MIVLRWPLRKWLSNCSLKTKITGASIFGHLCVLFSLFILYRGNEQYHILVTGSMIDSDVPIVFLPMHKSLKQNGGSAKSSSASASVLKNSDTHAITSAKKGTIAVAPAEVKSKKNPSRRIKGAPQDEKVKKNKAKKSIKEKILRQAQDELNKKKIEEKPKPVEPEKAIETPQITNQMQTEAIHAEPVEAQNVLYVGQQEMDALQMHDYIQQEMAQHWSPPSGMRKNISCTIKVMIGFDGTISNIDVEQSSGVLIFDGAAKRAATQLTPPQWAYGKEIVLTFKP